MNEPITAAMAGRAYRERSMLKRAVTVATGEAKVVGQSALLVFAVCFPLWLLDPISSMYFWYEISIRYFQGFPNVPDHVYWPIVFLISILPPLGWFLLKRRWREVGMGVLLIIFILLTGANVAVNLIGTWWGLQWASPGITLSRGLAAGVFGVVLVLSFGCEELWQMALSEIIGTREEIAAAERGDAPPGPPALNRRRS